MSAPMSAPISTRDHSSSRLRQRKLGREGFEVSAVGLGCMGMSWAYGQPDDEESIRTLERSIELGVDFWDTAEIYGPFKNEVLLSRALKRVGRDRVQIATKFGWTFKPDGSRADLDSSPRHIKQTVEGSLKRLGTDHIDLYYQHRLDPNTPIEDTVRAMSDLVREGKVRYIGLSEVGPETIRRAHAVHSLTAVQSEYSLWERGVEERVLPTLRELGIGFVPYSPMGRGFLTGTITPDAKLSDKDSRQNHPRFQGGNLEKNLELVKHVETIAKSHRATPAQIALAWLLRQGDFIVPIPGTKRVKYLEENTRAVDLHLPDSAWQELDRYLAGFRTAGTRYPEAMMKMLDSK